MASDHSEGTAGQAEMEPQSRGFFPSLYTALFGARVKRLTEETNRAHLLSYLLIIAQSVTTVLVFGLTEVTLVLHSSFVIRVIAALFLFILAATVLASDIALLETMRRIPALARNRQNTQMSEHVAYVAFVLLVEGATYAVALWALDSNASLLTSGKPLIPATGWTFALLIILRATLICWSAVQLIIVRSKLPVLLSTLMNTGKEIVGAHVERQLANLDISHLPVQATFGVYAKMAQPPRPIGGFLNMLTGGWVVRRALAQEAEEERQAHNVRDALEAFQNIPMNATTTARSAAIDTPTAPHLPAMPSSNGQNGNGRLNNRAKREALAAALYGAHPTSPRDNEYTLDESDWASSDGRGFGADDFGEYNDDGPQFRMSQAVNAKRNRATPARVAPRGVEMVFDLPEGKTAKRSDTPEARKVMNYLDKHPGAQIKQISEATGISKPTVRRYASTWSERQDSAKRMAKLTEEMPAITADMLPEMSTVVIDESPVYEPVQ